MADAAIRHSRFTMHDSSFPIRHSPSPIEYHRPMSAPPVELFRRLTNGIYVVTASHEGVSGGFTAAWITQVSFEPLLLATAINPGNATWPLIQRSRRFAINVLAAGQQETARHFGLTSGRDADKWAGVRTIHPIDGVVALADAVAWLGCRIEQQLSAGDHMVVVARVFNGDLLAPEAVPLRYADTGNMDGSAALYPARFPD
jgi:flavin reductase (DIM6/NTAB) family NADH-FMN oxidoreductase RutF